MTDLHGGALWRGVIKKGSHFGRQADTAVGGWVSGQIALMHSDCTIESHEVEHRRTDKASAGWSYVCSCAGILNDMPPEVVYKKTVEAGTMFRVFFDDFETTHWCVESFHAGRDGRNPLNLAASEKTHQLLIKADDDLGSAHHWILRPVTAIVDHHGATFNRLLWCSGALAQAQDGH